jgi:hypothetical protein
MSDLQDPKREPESGMHFSLELTPARMPGLGKSRKPLLTFLALAAFFVALGIGPSLVGESNVATTGGSESRLDAATLSDNVEDGSQESPATDDEIGADEAASLEPSQEINSETSTVNGAAEASPAPSPVASASSAPQKTDAPSPEATASSPEPSSIAGKTVTMPDVRGMSITEAQTLLRSLGIMQSSRTDRCSNDVPQYRVITSEPEGGDRLEVADWNEPGNYVLFYRSSGPCADSWNMNGHSMRYEPGWPTDRGELKISLKVVNSVLFFEIGVDATSATSDTTLDFGSSCTITLDRVQEVPCLKDSGERHPSVEIVAGSYNSGKFAIKYNDYGVKRPNYVVINFLVDSPKYGRAEQMISVYVTRWAESG